MKRLITLLLLAVGLVGCGPTREDQAAARGMFEAGHKPPYGWVYYCATNYITSCSLVADPDVWNCPPPAKP